MALEYLPLLGQTNVPDYATQHLKEQMMLLQKRQIDAQIDQHNREVAEQDAFQADVDHVLTNPSAENYSRLIVKHPDFAEKTKAAWSVIDKARQQSDLTQMGEIYSAAANGRYDLAASSLKRRIEADKAADGQSDPHDEAMLAAMESDDPVQQKAAMGMIGLQLSAITGPDKFEQTLGALTKGQEGFTLSPGSKRYGADGKLIAEAPFAPREISVSPGEKVFEYQPGGGDQASDAGGAAVSPDLPPAQAAVASTLSSAGLPGHVVAGFLGNFHVEGGYGGAQGDGGSASGIAQWHTDRLQNFERIVGKPVSEATPEEQAKFVVWEMQHPEDAGMTVEQRDAILNAKTAPQAAALIDQFYERSSGEHRQQRMAAANRFAGGGETGNAGPGLKLLTEGAPKPQPKRMTPQEVAAEGLDPKMVYYRGENGVPQAVGGQSTKENPLKPWPASPLTARAQNQASIINIDNALKLLDPKNRSDAAKNARNSIGIGTGMLGDQFTQYNDPKGADFRALIGQIGGVVIKDISGAAVSATEDERLKKWIPRVTDKPETVVAKLNNMRREIQQRNAAFDATYSPEQGYRQFQQGGGPVKVRSIQEAQKLAPGTLFVAPNGKTYRKK